MDSMIEDSLNETQTALKAMRKARRSMRLAGADSATLHHFTDLCNALEGMESALLAGLRHSIAA